MPALASEITPAGQAALERLAVELVTRGLTAEVCIDGGMGLHLDVSHPEVPAFSEQIYTQNGVFRWSWAGRIAECGDLMTAAAALSRAFHVRDGDRPRRAVVPLVNLRRRYPSWTIWYGPDGQYYGRHPDTPAGDYDARGDDPGGLDEAIQIVLASHQWGILV